MKVRLVARDADQSVQLTNGEYKSGNDPGAADFADVILVKNPMAFGDLNGDGQGDAAALLAENYGGTGVFVSVVAVLSAGGQPVQAGGVLVDDRPKVDLLAVQDGQILLAGKIHGPQDPGCCASLPVSEVFVLTKGGLVMRKQASTAPDGTQRVIKIQEPREGAAVPAAGLHITGTYTVAPFENTLTYRIFDGMHNTLAAGSLPASNGAFDTSIDLTGIPAGNLMRLEIDDLSAADGTMLAMDSVDLMIK